MSRELGKIAFVLLIFTFNSPFFPWRRCFSLHSKEKWFWVLAGYSGHRHWVPGHLPPATVLCSFYSKYYIQKLLWKNWISSGIKMVAENLFHFAICYKEEQNFSCLKLRKLKKVYSQVHILSYNIFHFICCLKLGSLSCLKQQKILWNFMVKLVFRAKDLP